MTDETSDSTPEETSIQNASEGHGPLWQREYTARLSGTSYSPESVMQLLREDFPDFSPVGLAAFSRDESTPLALGDEMKVAIQGYGECGVRVVHLEPHSLTLRTLEGHFEAGRITFGAYLENDELVVRIRSRARSAGRLRHVGYKLLGQKLQEQTWRIFLERVVERIGGQMKGEIGVTTAEVKSTLADLGELDTPTFLVKDR